MRRKAGIGFRKGTIYLDYEEWESYISHKKNENARSVRSCLRIEPGHAESRPVLMS
jgi:hypothetical protein